jgi:hypothetical protein
MIATDRDALTCDLAETYGIFDMRALPASTLAVLASGLRENSRIKMKLSGMKVDRETLLLGMAVDNLRFLAWTKTKAAQSGREHPKSVVQALLDVEKKPKAQSYGSGDEFSAAWERLAGGES